MYLDVFSSLLVRVSSWGVRTLIGRTRDNDQTGSDNHGRIRDRVELGGVGASCRDGSCTNSGLIRVLGK